MLRYALIGDPIAHSLSPRMQAAAFAACDIEATYEAIAVTKERAAPAVRQLRRQEYDGFNITTPLKDAVVPLVDSLTSSAHAVAAINTVRREPDGSLTGHNTDGDGLLRALKDVWEWQADGRRVLMLGSGPAARAFTHALRAAGAQLWCWSRNASTAARLGSAPTQCVDLVISALPSDAHVPEAILACIKSRTKIFDANYAAARCPVPHGVGGERTSGLPLLVGQGTLSFEWWTGMTAPVAAMRQAVGLA